MLEEVDATLSRFGERIGGIEQLVGGMKEKVDTLGKNIEDRKDNAQDWLKTLFPYLLVVGYLIIDNVGLI